MSWLDDLHAELARAGIRGRRRRRIELELADHLACDPGSEARLGSPREVAERFASELRVVRTRRAAWGGFAALALAAFGMLATTRAYAAAGGWPDVTGPRGLAVAITGVLVLVAPQVAFVAGMLGIARIHALRGRAEPPSAELALVQRRMQVALAAGGITVAGMLAHVCLLWGLMPSSWDAVALASVVAPAAALAAAELALRSSQAVTPAVASHPDGLAADVPRRVLPLVRPVLADPRRLVAAVGVPVCLLVLVATGRAESSLLEGLERAVFEGLAFVGCFVFLGRTLGLRR